VAVALPSQRVSVMKARPREGLELFLSQLSRLGVQDSAAIGRLASHTIECMKGDAATQRKLLDGELMRRWYSSLASGQPDYGVYGSPLYLAELWACWSIYSRKYLLSLHPPRNLPPVGIARLMHPVTRIVDLGCGCGYTAAGFRELFPDAQVVGTNISGSVQYRVACEMASSHGFSMVPNVSSAVGSTTLVFASEYFEHILTPIAHLREVVSLLRPRFMLIANAFGTTAIGHFREYIVGGVRVDGKKVQRIFNAELRRLGYKKVKTKLWNNRPALWAKSTGA
jgi:SAM-dependent methyltransferase